MLLAAVLLLAAPTACGWNKPKLFIFDTVFFDSMSSGLGEKYTTQAEIAAVKGVAAVLRKGLEKAGTYRILPPASGDDATPNLSCAQCVLDVARAQGADFLVTSAVFRATGTIQYLKVELDNVKTAKAVKLATVQLSGLSPAQLGKAAQLALKNILAETKKAGAE